jgi:hypothetical protein
MGTYVHHPWIRANLNKLIGKIEKEGVGMEKIEYVIN